MTTTLYQQLMEQASIGYVHYKIAIKTTNQTDFIIEEVNKVFETLIGQTSKNIVGKSNIQVFSKLNKVETWGDTYTQFLTEDSEKEFQFYSTSLGKWIKAQKTSINIDSRSILFIDNNDNKINELAIQETNIRVNKQRLAIADLLLHDAIVSGDMSAATPFMTELLSKTIDTARASIWLLSNNKEEMRCISLFESQESKHSEGLILYKKDFPNYFNALCTDTRIYAHDAQTDPRTNEFTKVYLEPLNITSMLDAGILINGETIGVVCLEHIGPARKWLVDEEAFASTAAAVISQILLNIDRRKTELELKESKVQLEDLVEKQRIEQNLREKQEVLLLELSTPVTQLWDGILLLPLVGIIDSKRAQDVMTTMLNKITDTQAKVFILDISGIAVVDTAVANYLIKITKATHLMGCRCFISGISGAVAQTIVELGIQIDEVETTGNMQDALRTAFELTGIKI